MTTNGEDKLLQIGAMQMCSDLLEINKVNNNIPTTVILDAYDFSEFSKSADKIVSPDESSVAIPPRWMGMPHCDYYGETISFMDETLYNPYVISRTFPTVDIFGRTYITPRQWLRRNTIFMLTQVCDTVFSCLHKGRASDMPEDWFKSKYPQIHNNLNPVFNLKMVNLAHKHHPSGESFYPNFPTISFNRKWN